MKKFLLTLVCLMICLVCLMSGCTSSSITTPAARTDVSFIYNYDSMGTMLTCTVLTDGTVELTKYSGYTSKLNLPSKLVKYTVTSIGEGAFRECSYLTEVSLPSSITSIGKQAFFLSGIRSISLPSSLTSIGDSAFTNCWILKNISIPESVTFIGAGAFGGCCSLETISIPNGVTSIGDGTFWACTALTSISIPDSVTFIGENAFGECPNLTLTVSAGSYAETYAKENNISYTTK